MSAVQLLTDLARLGVKLSVEAEQLQIRAPRGTLDATLRDRIVEHKQEILALLRRSEHGSASQLVPAPAERHLPFPLTEIQQAYLLGRLVPTAGGNVGCHFYSEVDAADLDIDCLAAAWRQLIDRHDVLRTVVLPDGRQHFLEAVPTYGIETLDLRGQPPEAVLAMLEETRRSMSHRVYNLEVWPLFDIRAIRLDERHTRIYFSIDLFLVDAASLLRLIEEWRHLYRDSSTPWVRPGLSFRDYVVAEAGLQGSDQVRAAESYWFRRVVDFPTAPELPLGPVPAAGQPEVLRHAGTLAADAWRRLKGRAAELGMTPTGMLAAAFSEVLRIWSRRQRFSITLTMFRRLPLHAEVNDLIGDFTSTLLLTCDAPPGGFAARAQHLQARLLEDMNHSHVGGVRVMREVTRARGRMDLDLMPIVFTSLLGLPCAENWRMGWLGKSVYAVTQTPQVWLDHQTYEHDGELCFHWDAIDAMFPEGMVADMFDAYARLLERLASDDAAWQEPVTAPLLLREEHLEPRRRANLTQEPTSTELLHTLFTSQAEARPTHLAIVSPERRMTYGELDRLVCRIGRRLRKEGAAPGKLVGVVMEKGWEQVAAVLGIVASGAAYLPIDAALPEERRNYLIAHGQVELVLTQSKVNDGLQWPDAVTRLCVDDETTWSGFEDGPLSPVQVPEDLAYVIYTSGSTGSPKGVVIDHRGAVNTILDINRRFGVGHEDRVLAVSSLSFDLSVYDIFGLLAAGGTIVLPDQERRLDPEHWAELVVREGVTLWNSVPTLMEMLVEHATGRPEATPDRLRLVLMSGDWIPVTLPGRIAALVGDDAREARKVQVMSLGGATEASIWSILYPIDHVDPAWKSIPYGRPMVNQTFHVLDEALDACPVWVPGHLYIGGIGLAKGYWRDEQKTRESFLRHPRTGEQLYRTGDMGRYLRDGNIEFLGRDDDQVKVGGHRIELGEIEAALVQHPGVTAAAVVAKGAHGGGKQLIGYVVPSNADAARRGSFDAALRDFLRAKLPAYMIPAGFMLLDALPLTANGKVDRKALQLIAMPVSSEAELVAPRDAMEASLAAIVMDVSGLQKVGIHQSFFELGINSILMVRIASRIKDSITKDFAVVELFRYATISALAARLQKGGSEEVPLDKALSRAEARRKARGRR
ncbi:non-ribosomal peptide synthetase [Polyangium fumosum]|uniref:Amino acid adenylation domain-containing protein n=1 Tax=Polyangium fumosum TaxID=889272 RepID=A0A4U1IQG3_9BACT|nr:non-ribosomal peptide synthetase [Polyangium fumosum]TKC96364.1 amino acid adenylation domain-containing protein [Polyangium fumosum]